MVLTGDSPPGDSLDGAEWLQRLRQLLQRRNSKCWTFSPGVASRPSMSYISYTYTDPYTQLRLLLSAASDNRTEPVTDNVLSPQRPN